MLSVLTFRRSLAEDNECALVSGTMYIRCGDSEEISVPMCTANTLLGDGETTVSAATSDVFNSAFS